jgi:hypothetical protein
MQFPGAQPVRWQPANESSAFELDVVVCTTGDHHLVERLGLPPGLFTHEPTNAEGPLLGFECHRVLRERLGAYDVYGYMEDDLGIGDSWFFAKLAWFTAWAGDEFKQRGSKDDLVIMHEEDVLAVVGS